MRLADRLRSQLLASPPAAASQPVPPDAARQARLAALRDEIARIERRWAREPKPSASPARPRRQRAAAIPSAFRERWAPGQRFGRTILPCGAELAHLATQVRRLVALGLPSPAASLTALRPEELLFLDTETTGLSRAAGTLVFLVGVGFFDADEGFVVEQLFLADPDDEPAMLAQLRGHLERARVLVTFNGRGFDVPLLHNRALLTRTPLPLDLPHVDLLPLGRKVFRSRTSDCRLKTLEREALGFERGEDIDGAEVPEIYLEYLRTGEPGRLDCVLHHNRIDIISLAPLLALVGEHVLDPLQWAEDGAELLALGQHHLRVGDAALAERCFARGLELARGDAARMRLFVELARLLRRRGDDDAASALWERYAEEFPRHNRGFIELAKHCEHVTRDLPRALAYAERAPHSADEGLARRLARLRRRLDAHRDGRA
jgi:hypothetical protein